MVSFTCNACQDVVKKPKVNGHAMQCGGASFTCVDCMNVFDLHTIKTHTSCITETEKYQGKWRQKQGPAAVAKRSGGADDSDDEETGKDKWQPLRPPRPPMNLGSDSDSDDDAWVTKRKKMESKEGQARNGSLHKRAKATTPPRNEAEVHCTTKRPKQESLKLPRAVTAADCIVPSFVLGTDEEVAEVTRWIMEDVGATPLSVRGLAKKMVERYNSRIAKHVQHAIETAIANGKLRVRNGVVTSP
ncbi:RNA binding protein [Trypanosoma rangeli]|uniref:RNA binding protein n=1 Tax=Trypanosoma rangeli TaxID=5698 RepID=A0A422NL54_TRYRA|nr:RNA binding protein [Trypanosoma rangeli]RNF06154.1 RNA binding protein [Trypanosoma rangeli]|eukprot:RNF06154.1 RNA binding protein [Trypanosoma rangeli]